jgi:hypothetical protein
VFHIIYHILIAAATRWRFALQGCRGRGEQQQRQRQGRGEQQRFWCQVKSFKRNINAQFLICIDQKALIDIAFVVLPPPCMRLLHPSLTLLLCFVCIFVAIQAASARR